MVQGGDSLIARLDSDQPASRPGSADHHHAVAQPPSVIMNSDMEAFGNRLSAIVNADFYAAALAVGPVDVPLGMHSTTYCTTSGPGNPTAAVLAYILPQRVILHALQQTWLKGIVVIV